jgi:hypothetical protein
VNAGSGNDVITLLDHFHLVDGGSGSDTVVLAGPRDSYQINQNGSSLLVQSKAFAGGTDTLTNVERLLFDDGAVAYDIAGIGGQIYRLYQAAFDRAPDKSGLGFWMHQMDEGMSLDTVASFFTSSGIPVPVRQPSEQRRTRRQAVSERAAPCRRRRRHQFWNNYLDHQGGTQAKTLAISAKVGESGNAGQRHRQRFQLHALRLKLGSGTTSVRSVSASATQGRM